MSPDTLLPYSIHNFKKYLFGVVFLLGSKDRKTRQWLQALTLGPTALGWVSILNPLFLLSWQTCLNAIGHRGQNTVVGNHFPSPGDLPNPGIEPSSPTLQADSLPAEPLGEPKTTGVGSLYLLQKILLRVSLSTTHGCYRQ